jgi:hypothetical protein
MWEDTRGQTVKEVFGQHQLFMDQLQVHMCIAQHPEHQQLDGPTSVLCTVQHLDHSKLCELTPDMCTV